MARANTKQPLTPSILLAALLCFLVAPPAAADGGGSASMNCLEKLKPCDSFLTDPSMSPSPECCAPLKEVIDKDTACLCALFENALLLQTMNITKDNALGVSKKCGSNSDPSLCKNIAASSPGTPSSADSHSSASNGSPESKSTESGSGKNAGPVVGVYVVILSFIGFAM